MPKAVDRWDASCGSRAFHEHKDFASLTSYFARSSASASESTLMAACGWRALMARMASPLSGMATSDHSCSGDAPLGFGSTVTIFHPVVMHLRLTSSLVPAHPTTSTRRANQFTATSLPGRVLAIIGLALGGDLAKKPLCNRPESTARCALGTPRKADTPPWQAFRAETVQPRLRPRAAASVAPRSHHGFQNPD